MVRARLGAVLLRSTLVGLVVLLVSATAIPTPAQGTPDASSGTYRSGLDQTKGLRHLRVIGFTEYPPLVAAQAFGYFAAEGLEFDFTITPSSTFQMQGLTRGDYDIAFTAFDNLLASATREGVQSRAFAITDVRDLSFYVRPEIQSYEDIRGRPLAADAVDTALALVLRRLLLAHGLDFARGDYDLVPAGGTPERLQSMVAGETFGAIMNPPWDERAREAGLRRLGHHSEVLPDYPGSTMAATEGWLSVPANRDAASRLLRAWIRAVDWVTNPANRATAVDLLIARLGVSRPAAELLLDGVARDNAPSPAGFAGVLNLRIDLGLVPPPGPPIERFYDLGIYEQARR